MQPQLSTSWSNRQDLPSIAEHDAATKGSLLAANFTTDRHRFWNIAEKGNGTKTFVSEQLAVSQAPQRAIASEREVRAEPLKLWPSKDELRLYSTPLR